MTPAHAFDDASAALVQDYDLTDMLVRTVGQAADRLGASAAGLLVTNDQGELELLCATSHVASELEAYQALTREGPCDESMRRLVPVELPREEVAQRWPPIGELMEDGGFGHVLSAPLRWHGSPLGGLNLFFPRSPVDAEVVDEAQRYGDVLTLFIVNAAPVSERTARERIEEALAGRALIEQAKGVLAEEQGLEMDEAYLRLLESVARSGEPLTEVARSVVLSGMHPRRLGVEGSPGAATEGRG